MPDDLLEPSRVSLVDPEIDQGVGEKGKTDSSNDDTSMHEPMGTAGSMRDFEEIREEVERQAATDDTATGADSAKPYSPYEAEPENITGVFRLKARTSNSSQSDEDASDETVTHADINPRPADGTWRRFFSNLNADGKTPDPKDQ
jgi:hypothetical protein